MKSKLYITSELNSDRETELEILLGYSSIRLIIEEEIDDSLKSKMRKELEPHLDSVIDCMRLLMEILGDIPHYIKDLWIQHKADLEKFRDFYSIRTYNRIGTIGNWGVNTNMIALRIDEYRLTLSDSIELLTETITFK